MRVGIRDRDALLAVSPSALSAYARAAGWSRQEPYRVHSDVYLGEDRPEIIVPRTERLGDYASVVATLIDTFASVADQDELTVYRSLVTADRDVVRVRAGESAASGVTLNAAVDLIGGVRDMLFWAACSLREPRPVYREDGNREAVDLLSRLRLGQTDQAGGVVTVLTPVVPAPLPGLVTDADDRNASVERRMTRHLVEAVTAVREVAERAAAGDAGTLLGEAVADGVSANLCETLVRLIEPFPTLDVGVSWARTRPLAAPATIVRFGRTDAALVREAARSLRDLAPRPDVSLCGFVRLTPEDAGDKGTISLLAKIDGQRRLVSAVLERPDYRRALQAHRDRTRVVLSGDLALIGPRWWLLSARLTDFTHDDGPEP